MINIYCESGQFLTLFFNTKIKITEYKSNDDLIGTLEFDGGQKEEFRVRFVTPWMDLVDDIRKKIMVLASIVMIVANNYELNHVQKRKIF